MTHHPSWPGRVLSSASWQTAGVVLACVFVAALHLGNDGLWLPGDAPRHAGNGLFWWDLLTTLPDNAVEFGLRYRARYPVVNPVSYPPVFYLLEGAAFALFGASPFVAKGLVLAFALVAGLYTTAWLRRFVSPEAGWGGLVLILQPGMVAWSHAVMLNVPSTALGLAALYHARLWLQAAGAGHLHLAAVFTVLGVLTYFQTGVVVPIILAWIIVTRQWHVFRRPRTLVIAAVAVVLLVPVALLVLVGQPVHLSSVAGRRFDRLTYYFGQLPVLFHPLLLGAAGLGIALGVALGRWRRELGILLAWGVTNYVVLSVLTFKNPRYILPIGPLLVALAMIGVTAVSEAYAARSGRPSHGVFAAVMAVVLAVHVMGAALTPVRRIEGLPEVVAFIERVAPRGRVLYHGDYNGAFTFYVRARDPDFARAVVLGHRFLSGSAVRELAERLASAEGVVAILRKECGCEWIAVERGKGVDLYRQTPVLRQALAGPEFELVRSFPIRANRATHVDLYRLRVPFETPDTLEIRLPRFRGVWVFRVPPLRRSAGRLS